jgi:FkbH-like protein
MNTSIKKSTCLFISNFVLTGISNYLNGNDGTEGIDTIIAPFNQTMQIMLDEEHPLWHKKPEYAVVWTYPEAISTQYKKLLETQNVDQDELFKELEDFVQALIFSAMRVKALFIPIWIPDFLNNQLGLLSFNTKYGANYYLNKINLFLTDKVSHQNNIFFLDTHRWINAVGQDTSNPKLWYWSKMKFGNEVLKLAADDIKSAINALQGKSKKLIICDLDDTLWGGIVGDIGWEKLRLGGHDAFGEAFSDVQKQLKNLKNRGVLLGIVSKNTERIALDAIQNHPEMKLQINDFVGWRINWEDKAKNIIDLVSSINIGLDSVVFLDDSPHERARIRQALPDILVPELPDDKLLCPSFIANLDCFNRANLSQEDITRTEMYKIEEKRSYLKSSAQSIDEYLRSLEINVFCEVLSNQTITRATQLLNKTNQMNLSTRRLSDEEFLNWANQVNNCVLVYKVADKFGHYGLVGIAGIHFTDENHVILTDFLLSCRVFGKGIEKLMIGTLLELIKLKNKNALHATFISTSKNQPCQLFLDEFAHEKSAENQYCWQVKNDIKYPEHIQLHKDFLNLIPDKN